MSLRPDATQEANSEKTNNGIHYRLQLLYSNGEAPSAAGTWGSGRGGGRGHAGAESASQAQSWLSRASPAQASPEKPLSGPWTGVSGLGLPGARCGSSALVGPLSPPSPF